MSSLTGYETALAEAKRRAKESHLPAFVVEDAYYGRWIVAFEGSQEAPRLSMDAHKVTWVPAQWNGTRLLPESFIVRKLCNHY